MPLADSFVAYFSEVAKAQLLLTSCNITMLYF